MSGPNHGPCSTLVVTQVFKCGCRKEEDKPYTLISEELAGWIGMATPAHLAGRGHHTHPTTLG